MSYQKIGTILKITTTEILNGCAVLVYLFLINVLEWMQEKARRSKKKDWKGVSEVCNKLGNLYSRAGEYELSLAEHKEELEISKKLNEDMIEVATAHRNVGEVLSAMEEHDAAMTHLET